MEVYIGYWIIPTLVTIVSFGIAYKNQDRTSDSSYGLRDLVNAIIYVFAAIPSLVAWLIWALLV